MDQELRLRNHASVIDPATDFAYKWGLNVGLSDRKARRLALAVDEIVTDVVKFAYPGEEETFQIAFRHDLTTAEVIIREQGVPFDPSEIAYDRERAVEEGNFDGAGYAVVQRCVDEIQFLNKGQEGKEFRLVQHVEARHIVELAPAEVVQDTEVPDDDVAYTLVDVTPSDARDIAKLIYRTYGDTYSKEELYYPDTIEQALRNDEKFGVMVRTEHGAAVGYFAVLRSDDSAIGEVGEAVVDVNHRRRGLMTRMLEALIQRAETEGLLGVYGEAVTVHFRRDFNLLTARHLRQVAQGAEHVRVDLSHARIVDTEALAALWALQDDGMRVTLYDPPDLFHDLVEALDLEDVFEVEVAEA